MGEYTIEVYNNSTEELESYKVNRDVYVYIRQLENAINHEASRKIIFEKYPERFKWGINKV